MILTDTHSHIYLENFNNDRDEVILKAFNQAVKYIFLPNIDSASVEDMLKLSRKYPDRIFPMIGLHPSSVEEDYMNEFEKVISYINKEKFYAIGEIGLDYYWDTTYKEEQKDIFKKQLGLAITHNLSAIIHVRKAFNDVVEIIKQAEYKELTGIFHCFSGSIEQANIIIDLGFKLGIGGVVTFKNSKLDKVIEQIDLRHIVLETDSPYLTPEPKRGKRNESTYTRYIAKKIAEIKQVSLEQVADITTKNAEEVFKVKLN